MANDTPVVFLAFANAPDAHLENLKTESRRVYRTLQPLEDDGKIRVHREESSEIDELYQDLLRHDGRIVIFHYGGHADGNTLRLEGGDGGGEGLADLLGQQSGLKLVFLNGCATKGHVKRLLDAGVPAVIATSVPIGDVKAQEFANAFYIALAEGRSIAGAFDSGSAFVQGKHGAGGDAGVVFTRSGTDWEDEDEEEYDTPVLEWGLYLQESCADDLEQWRLPQAQSAWEILLTGADGPLRSLDGSPYRLKYHAPSRTVSALICANCGTTVMAAAGEATACAICGSSDVQAASVPTQVADQVVPFRISEDDARKRVAEFTDGARVELHAVFLPYWIIDAGTRSTFKAERGVVRDFTADTPKPEWEPVTDTVDIAFKGQLVGAGTAPVGRAADDRDWYWELGEAKPLEASRLTESASVPLDRSLSSVFDQTATRLRHELDAEVVDRVGGHQRRNITTDTRYRELAVRTILLPHWYATVELEEGKAGIVINGQTAAARVLQLPGVARLTHGDEEKMNKRTYESGSATATTANGASVFAGIGIGLMVGLLLGMSAPSAKPVVGIFIGAVGVALAALLGLNDKNFSTAKGLRIGSFGLAVFLAAPAGIYARDHGLFSPGLGERITQVTSLGYSKDQALSYLIKSEAAAKADGNELMALMNSGKSYLFAGEGQVEACNSLAQMRPYDKESTFAQVQSSFTTLGPEWKSLAAAANKQFEGADRQSVLFITRDAVCGLGEFREPVAPTAADCSAVASIAPTGSEATSINSDGAPVAFKILIERLNNDLTAGGRASGLRLLERALCPVT